MPDNLRGCRWTAIAGKCEGFATPGAIWDGGHGGLECRHRNTPAIYPKAGEAGWQTYTWKLQDAHLTGRQNGNADLRLAGAPGFAVHQVTLGAPALRRRGH